ncbi:MAG: GTPase HflX [Alphaproteobacteria bacterium]|nr:GTPase HflX [Alphaproteobacteria bacterium]MBQ2811345.1 GTPase HflX [Alphaproteobacteria bacterium]
MVACVICPLANDNLRDISDNSRLSEAVGLALAIDLDIVHSELVKVKNIKPSTYFSKGFIEKIKPEIAEKQIVLMIVDTLLTPIQQRNLEKELNIKVIDRTALILEIFGKRANTGEGKLQVELAHLTYQRSRLVRSWTHLERQRGGAGFLGGPGEKQIELDRRIIDDKIVKIKKELEKVKNTRHLQRGNRKKVPYPIVALVGYTNAGKSTLFNKLSGADVLAKDMLFATLDPTLRKIELPSGREVIFSDTVGFISDLPHELIMAFRSTLEEVLEADIVVHVRDIANENTLVQRKDVLDVLENIGLKDIENKENYIEVLNKVDLLAVEDKNILEQKLGLNTKEIIFMSAITGKGCDELLLNIDKILSADYKTYTLEIDIADGKLQSWIYDNAIVLQKDCQDDKLIFNIKINQTNSERLSKLFNIKLA